MRRPHFPLGTYLPDIVQLTGVNINVTNIAFFEGYTLNQCEDACRNTANCSAFSINCSDGDLCGVQRNNVDPAYECALKNAIGTSNLYASNGASTLVYIDGSFVLLIDFDFVGNDLFSMSDTVTNCVTKCLQTVNCSVITFNTQLDITTSSIQTCWLKRIGNIDWIFNGAWQSYLMPKTTVSGSTSMTQCFPALCSPGKQILVLYCNHSSD